MREDNWEVGGGEGTRESSSESSILRNMVLLGNSISLHITHNLSQNHTAYQYCDLSYSGQLLCCKNNITVSVYLASVTEY